MEYQIQIYIDKNKVSLWQMKHYLLGIRWIMI